MKIYAELIGNYENIGIKSPMVNRIVFENFIDDHTDELIKDIEEEINKIFDKKGV